MDDILTAEQRRRGFSLEEDDHCLHLFHKGERVAIFSVMGATIEEIREKADRIGSE